MNLYFIQIDYTLGNNATTLTFGVQRRAPTAGAAIAAATAAFQAVSNVRTSDEGHPPTYVPYIKITEVTATLIPNV